MEIRIRKYEILNKKIVIEDWSAFVWKLILTRYIKFRGEKTKYEKELLTDVEIYRSGHSELLMIDVEMEKCIEWHLNTAMNQNA